MKVSRIQKAVKEIQVPAGRGRGRDADGYGAVRALGGYDGIAAKYAIGLSVF